MAAFGRKADMRPEENCGVARDNHWMSALTKSGRSITSKSANPTDS
jgi:hypothetical protein